MNTSQLICFLTVAETLNFARAAEQLHVTQPAVTQQIHALEGELNMQLFRRTTRTVELTQEGLLFLGDAKAMVDIYERAKKRAEFAAADRREFLIIGCHSHHDVLDLARVLERMKAQFSNLYPVFRVVPFQHLYQRLAEEAVDVVIAFWEREVKRMHYQELMKVPAVAMTMDTSFAAPKRALQLCDLRQVPIVVLDPQKCPEEYRKLLHRALEDRSPNQVYFCDAVEAAIALAQAGYGLAILPDFQKRDPSFQYLPIVDASPMSYGVYYKTLTSYPLRKAFVQLAKESFPQSPLT